MKETSIKKRITEVQQQELSTALNEYVGKGNYSRIVQVSQMTTDLSGHLSGIVATTLLNLSDDVQDISSDTQVSTYAKDYVERYVPIHSIDVSYDNDRANMSLHNFRYASYTTEYKEPVLINCQYPLEFYANWCGGYYNVDGRYLRADLSSSPQSPYESQQYVYNGHRLSTKISTELQFNNVCMNLPPFPKGDSNITYQKSVQLIPYGESQYTSSYVFQLYDFAKDAEEKILKFEKNDGPWDIENDTHSYVLHIPPTLVRTHAGDNENYVSFCYLTAYLHSIPKQKSVNDARVSAETANDIVNDCAPIVANIELSVELSGLSALPCWLKGGDNRNCYGSSIGNSLKQTVIDLNNRCLKKPMYGSDLYFDGNLRKNDSGELIMSLYDGIYNVVDGSGVGKSFDASSRKLYGNESQIVDWENGKFYYNDNQPTIDMNERILTNNGSTISFKDFGFTVTVANNDQQRYVTCIDCSTDAEMNSFKESLSADTLTMSDITISCHSMQCNKYNADSLKTTEIISNGNVSIGAGNVLTLGKTSLSESQLKVLLEKIK